MTNRFVVPKISDMPVPPSSIGGVYQPSCLDRVKYGLMMGFCLGVATGAIFGGFNCLRLGLRGRELVQTVGKGMLGGGGTFGFFMAVGVAIRC
ncbi:unnamed protein product [Dicrocoelium dendriticum]|nr:unnamed protein product [Dicrocoelium dendriticum]